MIDNIKKKIRETYGNIASSKDKSSCGCGCGCSDPLEAGKSDSVIGYSQSELNKIPEGSDMGLGCGNPTAIASLNEGETVLDLGSGGGIDCFLAADKVGKSGKVIGVDMTAQMIDRARANAKKSGVENVEFRLGEIEHLPVADSTVDVVISNCVINLVPEKSRVFDDIYRVLKPGGRFMISDVATLKELPAGLLESASAWAGCVSGAIEVDRYVQMLKEAGFKNVEVVDSNPAVSDYWLQTPDVVSYLKGTGISREEVIEAAKSITSIRIKGEK